MTRRERQLWNSVVAAWVVREVADRMAEGRGPPPTKPINDYLRIVQDGRTVADNTVEALRELEVHDRQLAAVHPKFARRKV